MSSFQLNAVETRVLGCLLEKERLTPENYPLSLNSLTLACNQSTNREPVADYDEKTVESGVNALREKKLASSIFGAGSRVQKYRHKLLDHFELAPGEVALLCGLMLRGAQTPGELRSRTERLHPFANLAEVETCLEELAHGSAPLVRMLDARPGQKERRYVQLLSVEAPPAEATATASDQPERSVAEPPAGRVETLAQEVEELRAEVKRLREELASFRRQFD